MIPKLAICTVIVIASFVAGWTAQHWKMSKELATIEQEHAEELRDLAEKSYAAIQAAREQEQETAAALAKLDQTKTKELEIEKAETRRLRSCIANGTCGVRIKPSDGPGATTDVPESTATDSLEPQTSTLPADVQQRILDLREAIVEDTKALEYLQEYAIQCSKLN